jgi:hypothetical protein
MPGYARGTALSLMRMLVVMMEAEPNSQSQLELLNSMSRYKVRYTSQRVDGIDAMA